MWCRLLFTSSTVCPHHSSSESLWCRTYTHCKFVDWGWSRHQLPRWGNLATCVVWCSAITAQLHIAGWLDTTHWFKHLRAYRYCWTTSWKESTAGYSNKGTTARHTLRGHQFNIMSFPPGGLDCLISGQLEGAYQDSWDLSTSWSWC